MTPTQAWLSAQHRKNFEKARNPSKSSHIESCSYVIEEFVGSVSGADYKVSLIGLVNLQQDNPSNVT